MSTDQKYFLGKRVCPNCRRTLGAYKMRQLLVNDRIDSRFPTIALDALTIRPHSSYGPGRAGTRLSHGSIYLSHGSAVRHRQPGSARYTHAARMPSARKSRAGMPVACQSWLPLALGKGRARDAVAARIILASLAEWLRKPDRESISLFLAGVISNARCVTRSG